MEKEKGISRHLGNSTIYKFTYSPELLVREAREANRTQYGITEETNMFGYDVWNCFELSFLLDNGFPIASRMKLVYSSKSKYIVESKSLKLYLNSFNMEKMGRNQEKATLNIQGVIKNDLLQLLGPDSEVTVKVWPDTTSKREESSPFNELTEFTDLKHLCSGYHSWKKIDHYKESPELLSVSGRVAIPRTLHLTTDLLRSNCKITNQPDWGDLYIIIESNYMLELDSLLRYIISFRSESHFHEEVVEMVYQRLLVYFKPTKLFVAALYTRRGGIDINPVRVSDPSFLQDLPLVNPNTIITKTLRQ